MKTSNVRLGFATNSSSSHSIIFNPSLKLRDQFDDYFQWDDFVLTSKEAKEKYVSAMLVENLEREFSNDMIDVILKGLDLPITEKSEYGRKYSIDHQSVFKLPYDFDGKHVSIDFFKEFKKCVLKDGVHIFGGNDNDCDYKDKQPEGEKAFKGDWERDGERGLVCRKDGDWWILFSKRTGNRLITSFEENPKPFKPETPLLVDLKITNFCTHGCSFCYQGSSQNGLHMDKKELWNLPEILKHAKVFEVAIGGGEPTEYPHLIGFIGTRIHIYISHIYIYYLRYLKNVELYERYKK